VSGSWIGAWPRETEAEEIMERPDLPREELRHALIVLARLNRLFLSRRMLAARVRPGRVLDVATGGADIPEYLRRRGIAHFATGIERSEDVVSIARDLSVGVHLARADALRLPFADHAFDTATAHLFFHHLNEDECVAVLREMARVARRVVVLDLERSRVLCGFLWVVLWFSGNRITRHDGPLSVRRSWTKSEVRELAARAGVRATVSRAGPYRWVLVGDT
jgi:ubiquinone/menaquinone biosynthesis C-methylase UbiE